MLKGGTLRVHHLKTNNFFMYFSLPESIMLLSSSAVPPPVPPGVDSVHPKLQAEGEMVD